MPSVAQAEEFLAGRLKERPRLAVILGSGFGAVADSLEQPVRVPYGRIPGFLSPSVAGHAGELLVGRRAGRSLLILSGRSHYYEGHSLSDITFPVRVLAALGARVVVLTAAVGSLREDFPPGSLVLARDHINWLGANPLAGSPRFLDLADAYAPELAGFISGLGRECGLNIPTGVHAACAGPTYETPAEIRALRLLGADTVGMSVVPEAIVAKECGLKTAAVLGVANYACGIQGSGRLSHGEVLEKMTDCADKFGRLLDRLAAAPIDP